MLSILAFVLAQQPVPPVEAPAVTPPPAPTAEERIALGEQRLGALDDQGALDAVKPVVDDPTVPSKLRARAAMLAAISMSNLLQPEKALDAFKLALGADPTMSLPANAPEKAAELFKQARVDLATATRGPPPPLPPKAAPVQERVLGWTRPTSYLLMASGGVILGVGAVLVGAFTALRWYVYQRLPPDSAQFRDYSRALFPIALAAGVAIVLSIPVAGVGLALFFLSGADGPLRDKVEGQQD